jgi:hypothetical protein
MKSKVAVFPKRAEYPSCRILNVAATVPSPATVIGVDGEVRYAAAGGSYEVRVTYAMSEVDAAKLIRVLQEEMKF